MIILVKVIPNFCTRIFTSIKHGEEGIQNYPRPEENWALPAWTLLALLMDFVVQGFDEYMNLVLDDAEEVSVKRKTRKAVGELV